MEITSSNHPFAGAKRLVSGFRVPFLKSLGRTLFPPQEIPRFSELKPAVLDSAVPGTPQRTARTCYGGFYVDNEFFRGVTVFSLELMGNDGSKFLPMTLGYI